jgi:glycosyltransferase involved in cell wall biosynthesis
MKDTLSVVMSVHNDEPFLCQAVESILGQGYGDFEFVVVDDGSTDGSRDILESYASHDQRMRVIVQENAGLTVSLNRVVQTVRGDLIARMDGDDVSVPDRLNKLRAELLRSPNCAVVGGNCELIDDEGRLIGYRIIDPHDPNTTIRKRVIYQHGDVLFRRVAFLEVGGYRPAFRFAQDYDLWLRVGEHYRLTKIPDITYQLRITAGMVSSTKRMQQNEYARIARRYARERVRYGRDSYQEEESRLHLVAGSASSDPSFSLVYKAFVRYRDLGKQAARCDLEAVLASDAHLKWKALARALLFLPAVFSTILGRSFRASRT